MSLLIKNATFWQWDTPVSEATPQSCVHNIVSKKWIAVSADGKFIIPEDDHATLSAAEEQAYDSCIDTSGRLLLPGLIDAHIHVSMTGESIHFVDLKECRSIEQLVQAVEQHIQKHGDLSWIIGVNWDQTKLGRYPTRHDIDSISKGLKVFLWRACWHIGLANSAALAACGIDADSVPTAPPGGVIDHDGSSVTGILRERAVEVVMRAISNKSNEEKSMFIKNGLDMCLQYGLTSVQSNDESAMDLYDELLAADELPIRVFLTPTHEDVFGRRSESLSVQESGTKRPKRDVRPVLRPEGICPGGVATAGDVRRSASRLVIDRVKIFGDGSLGAETAAMRVAGDEAGKGYKGVLMHQTEAMRDMISEAKRGGYRLEIHAIGDAAAEQVLQCMRDSGITPADRAILTHCQVLGADLIEMMVGMGVIANIQPSFVPTDMEWASSRLTSEVLQYSYAWKTLMASGVWCAGGSDAPVETCSPWVGIYDAMFRERRSIAGGDAAVEVEVFRPEERLSFAEALWTYTAGAAFAGKCEGSMGRVQAGFCGDFILVDPNIIMASSDSRCKSLLRDYAPDMVVVGGEIVHVSGSSAVPILAAGGGHRGLKRRDTAREPTTMGGPYIPGKNGSLWQKSPDHSLLSAPPSVSASSKRDNNKRIKRNVLLCQAAAPLCDSSSMFSARPYGSCVCILTGAWLRHQSAETAGGCGMKLRSEQLQERSDVIILDA